MRSSGREGQYHVPSTRIAPPWLPWRPRAVLSFGYSNTPLMPRARSGSASSSILQPGR